VAVEEELDPSLRWDDSLVGCCNGTVHTCKSWMTRGSCRVPFGPTPSFAPASGNYSCVAPSPASMPSPASAVQPSLG